MSQIEQLSLLIKKLREEQIYVNSEKKHLIELHRQVLKKAEQLFRKTWIISYQHILLDDLNYGRAAVNTNNLASLKQILNQYCAKYTNLNKKPNFIESYKLLSYNDYKISEFLKNLKDNPKYLATFLVKCEKIASPTTSSINVQYLVPIIFNSLYANGLLINDEMHVLQLLKQLIELQFTDNVDLRRLIRKQSCSFNIVFKYYTEFVFSTRLFLTAALHEPILQLLMQDEWFYDIDPNKALERFSPEERHKRFGDLNSEKYKIEFSKHRELIVNKLYKFTMAFIDSINSSLFCFPSSLGWLVSHIFNLLTNKNTKITVNQQQDARKICCDLIMALYVCPAICDPEPYGVICDISISVCARHNLMQIAQILQVLAMYDDKEATKSQDLYSKFRSNCVSDILNTIIISNSHENYKFYLNKISSPTSTSSLSSIYETSQQQQSTNNLLVRTSMMITLQDTNKLILFIHHASKDLDKESEEYKWIKSILPTDYLNTLLLAENNQQKTVDLVPDSSTTKLKTQSSKDKKKQSIDYSSSSSSLNELSLSPSNESIATELANYLESLKVLIININEKSFDCPGMLSEDKVLQEYEYFNTSQSSLKHVKHVIGGDKKHDNEDEDRSSIDKLEINNQSINTSSSSNDDDDDDDDDVNEREENEQDVADGLSEFNFSGRDTPIISGRDTPSSYSHDDQIRRVNVTGAGTGSNNQNLSLININYGNNSNLSRLPVTVHKENREDINDKFCKFEINKVNAPVKEEQLSEAWSLDADPPDSVINEPINDQLVEDQNISNLSAFLNNSRTINSQQQQQVPLINISSSSFINNNEFITNRAESITSSDVCSESALSNDDRYYENEQQEQNYNNFRYINPITSIIDAISNKIDEKFHTSQHHPSTCVTNTPTTTTITSTKSTKFSIFSNKQQSPKQQQQQQQGLSTPKKGFGIFSRKSKSNKIEQILNENIDEAATTTQTTVIDADNILKKYSQTPLINKQPQQQHEKQSSELLVKFDDYVQTSAAAVETKFLPPSSDLAQFYDSGNFEQCKAFQDAKKKLRIVLSQCDINNFNSLKSIIYLNSASNKENFLSMFLKAQLYEAISLQDTEKEARLDETMRCIQMFSELECNQVLKSLKADHKKRVYYISYLTKSKQNLLYSNSYLDKLIQRTDSQHKLCIYHFTSVVTRLYLETRESQIQKFTQQFKTLVALDEKFDLYKQFVRQLNVDFDQIWQMCTKDEIDYAHLFIERLLMSRVYVFAMFPNGEIDHHRDRKAFECLQNLSNIITPGHPLIAIPIIYHNEAPWNAAQVELKRINAYKTPQDKLNCIRKCMDAIQNLLSIAKAPVCADDIQPVLTYVIIKANPTGFLSTVQYIEGFYGKQLEQEFYWTQFLFAFSYIKAELLKNPV